MFEDLLQKNLDLDDEMYEAITALVSEQGGFVRTDNNEYDDFRDSMYAIVFDEAEDRYADEHILAVAVTDNGLEVYTDPQPNITIKGMSKEDILDDKDAWYSIHGGMVLVSPTLASICECIGGYIE